MLARQVSRTEEKGAGASGAEAGAVGDDGARRRGPSVGGATVGFVEMYATFSPPEGCCCLFDEPERRRLMADIMRIVCDARMPETTRVAGLTLIGWLARRRADEAPHAVGIPEARESEQRLRAKAR
jgi:hypothetical protein